MHSDTADYYEILQVSRRADPLMIGKAFRLLAAFYHPDNRETGDEAVFREILEAYRTLSDPVRRAAYDEATYGAAGGANREGPALDAFDDVPPSDECELRRVILDALYHVRRSRPYNPVLPVMAIAELSGRTMDDLQFPLWYLRGKKWIEMPDGSDVAITVAGVDEVESQEGERENGDGDRCNVMSLRGSVPGWHRGAPAMLSA